LVDGVVEDGSARADQQPCAIRPMHVTPICKA